MKTITLKLSHKLDIPNPNHNNRVYKKEDIVKELDRKIAENDLSVYMHKDDIELDVNPRNVVGEVKGYNIEDDGTVKLNVDVMIHTEKGKLLTDKVPYEPLNVGMRGLGYVVTDDNGLNIVKDYQLMSIDILMPKNKGENK